ncbi:hypothetical protein [Flavobacterium eburneipallidum]|uniref:hypothetical protein n=1 Tax=Flavobacterium eburneipallidum TaxID=3003263 RepID=UPI002483266B|nr:hypothetical protein [Flavobacterium eburneipallidum]
MPTFSTHEPGHVLQYRILGRFYYPLIALPSLINTQLNLSIFDYTEKSANTLWYIYTGEYDKTNEMYFFDVKKIRN